MKVLDDSPSYGITHYVNPAFKAYIVNAFRDAYPDFSESEADDMLSYEPQYDSELKSYNEEHAESPIKKEYLVINTKTKKPVDEKRYSDYKEAEDAVNALFRKWFRDKKETAASNIVSAITQNDLGRKFD